MSNKYAEWFMTRVSPNVFASVASTAVMTGLLVYSINRGINRANRPIEIDPMSPEQEEIYNLYRKGIEHKNKGEYDKSKHIFKLALAKDPESEMIQFKLWQVEKSINNPRSGPKF